MAVQGLGRAFDVGTSIVPVNLATGNNTGHRLHMRNYGGVAICGYAGVSASAAESPTFIVQEHDAATGSNSQNLAVVDEYWTKSEAALDGDEAWVRVTQSATSHITNADWDDALQFLFVAEVDAGELSDGFEWISVNVADTGNGAHIGCAFYIPYELHVQRTPSNLAQPNA